MVHAQNKGKKAGLDGRATPIKVCDNLPACVRICKRLAQHPCKPLHPHQLHALSVEYMKLAYNSVLTWRTCPSLHATVPAPVFARIDLLAIKDEAVLVVKNAGTLVHTQLHFCVKGISFSRVTLKFRHQMKMAAHQFAMRQHPFPLRTPAGG